MKHVTDYLLEITQLQFILQTRLDEQEALFNLLSGEPNSLNTIATLPKLEADLCQLSALTQRINGRLQTVSAHPG